MITEDSGPAGTIASGCYETTVNGAYESPYTERRFQIQKPIVPRETTDAYEPHAHSWRRINLYSVLGSCISIDLNCGLLGAMNLDYFYRASDLLSRFEGEVPAFVKVKSGYPELFENSGRRYVSTTDDTRLRVPVHGAAEMSKHFFEIFNSCHTRRLVNANPGGLKISPFLNNEFPVVAVLGTNIHLDLDPYGTSCSLGR